MKKLGGQMLGCRSTKLLPLICFERLLELENLLCTELSELKFANIEYLTNIYKLKL